MSLVRALFRARIGGMLDIKTNSKRKYGNGNLLSPFCFHNNETVELGAVKILKVACFTVINA